MRRARERLFSTILFVRMAMRYWLAVYPRVVREMRHWHARASEVPDPLLRSVALEAQRAKRGNIEGAAAFAALVPRRQRGLTVRMLVAWQAAYDYADLLSEQPCAEPAANSRQVHLALLRALQPGVAHDDYYVHCTSADDGGYMREMVDTTRIAFSKTSNVRPVTRPAERAIARIIDYQALNQDEHGPLARWAETVTVPASGLQWWETAAAGASSLAVLALLAAAADPRLQAADIPAVEGAYYPWIGALHTLLDSLIDLHEDAEAGQPSLLVHYASAQEAAARMQMLADRALRAARSLRQGGAHLWILVAMASLYLTAPTAGTPAAALASEGVLEALGEAAIPCMLVLRARRLTGRLLPAEIDDRARGLAALRGGKQP
jgi:tetraprenyl-beta-curcumene synthase